MSAKPIEAPQRILAHDAPGMIGEIFAIERAVIRAGDDTICLDRQVCIETAPGSQLSVGC